MVHSDSTLPPPTSPFEGSVGDTRYASKAYWPQPTVAHERAPNILLIMTDDVGFGASSTFGGPISTPTMTKLASEGLKYNRFHTTSLCSPTRAALLTGRMPHNASFGHVEDNSSGYPGYNAHIPKSCATIADYLGMNGYSTAWFGKNHNTPSEECSAAGPFERWPTGMGFDHFYGFMGGDCDQIHPNVWRNNTPVFPSLEKKKYHLDSDLADQAIKHIHEQNSINPDRPFFVYYVPGACHAPHQVPAKFVKPYRDANMFAEGWDIVRRETWMRQKEMGIIPQNTKLTKRPDAIPSWESCTDDEKRAFTQMMQAYAGYLTFTDHNIGRVIDCLEDIGQKENTLVIYIQGDNGGAAEGTLMGSANEHMVLGNGLTESWDYILSCIDNETWSTEMCYSLYPVQWAWGMNSPMQWTKGFASHFGGTRNGMVIRWPCMIKDDHGEVRSQFHHVSDVLPTLLQAARVKWPVDTVNGHKQAPYGDLEGIAFNYTWRKGATEEKRLEQLFEMSGNRGYYQKPYMWCTTPQVFPWMAAPEDMYPYQFPSELYNLDDDFSQAKNLLSDEYVTNDYTEKAEELEQLWWTKARENNVLPLAFTGKQRGVGAEGEYNPNQGRKTYVYPNGVVRIPESCAPTTKNVSYKVNAYIELEDGKECEGVMVKMGGRFGGWGLVMFGNKPTWMYKLSSDPDTWHRLDAVNALTAGKHVISARFAYKGGTKLGGPGVFALFVDGKKVAGPILAKQTVPKKYAQTETFDVGQNCGSPVMDDYADKLPFKFTGKLEKVVVEIDDSNVTPLMRKMIAEALKSFDLATD